MVGLLPRISLRGIKLHMSNKDGCRDSQYKRATLHTIISDNSKRQPIVQKVLCNARTRLLWLHRTVVRPIERVLCLAVSYNTKSQAASRFFRNPMADG